MRLAAVVAALGLALLAGTAHASTFTVLPASLPSSETPNARGALVLPTAWTEHAARPQQLPLGGLAPLWREAGTAYGIPWQVLAAINEIESNFGQNMGPSSAGAVGWMQFMPETWLRWGMDGNADGVADPWNAEDAIYAASRYLAAAGGRVDIRRAVFAYNHADWYVREVFERAASYRGALSAVVSPQLADPAAAVAAVLANPGIRLTGVQRVDLATGLIDRRVVALLVWLGERHTIVVTSLRSDHSYFTASGFVSNHAHGRAVDIGAVDGEPCTGTRGGACGRLAVEIAAIHGVLRSTELIYCFDPDGPLSSDGFARADHCDHVHAGYDA